MRVSSGPQPTPVPQQHWCLYAHRGAAETEAWSGQVSAGSQQARLHLRAVRHHGQPGKILFPGTLQPPALVAAVCLQHWVQSNAPQVPGAGRAGRETFWMQDDAVTVDTRKVIGEKGKNLKKAPAAEFSHHEAL